jgi:alpha-L-glutamate ligase-like protein
MVALLRRTAQLLRKRETVYGINRRNVELVYTHNPRRYYPLADDKLLAKERMSALGVPVPDTLAVCPTQGHVAPFVSELLPLENFVLKPARSSGGRGLIVVAERIPEGGWKTVSGSLLTPRELGHHTANVVYGVFSKDRADRAFAEPRIVPHPVFATLWSRGLCDIRVITLNAKPVMAMVRVPTHRSNGKANLHQGGLGLAVDLDSGRTFRALCGGKPVSVHPESNAPLLNVELPIWGEILRVAKLAAESVPLGYLGVDLVVDECSRCWVLEINVRPGLEIQNVNGRGLGPALERVA